MRHDVRLTARGHHLRPFTRADVESLLLPISVEPVARQWSPSLSQIANDADAVGWLDPWPRAHVD